MCVDTGEKFPVYMCQVTIVTRRLQLNCFFSIACSGKNCSHSVCFTQKTVIYVVLRAQKCLKLSKVKKSEVVLMEHPCTEVRAFRLILNF